MSPDVLLKCPRTGCPESKCYGESLDFPPIVPQEKNITVKLARHSPPPPPSDNSKNGFKLIDTIPNHHSPPKITTLTTFKGDAKFSDLYLLLFSLYILCIFFVSSLYFFVSSLYLLCISNGNTDDACGSRVWERWSTIEGSIKCQAGAENIRKRYRAIHRYVALYQGRKYIRKRYRAIQRDVALYRGRKYKETSDVGDGKYKRFGRRWRKPPSLPFPAPILSFLCFFYFQPFQRLWWSSNLTRYLSLKLYYSSTITTYSKVVVKMYYYNILLSCFQNIQGSTNCLRLSSGFYSLSPSYLYLWCCNWAQSGEEYLRNGFETPTPPSPLSNWEHLQKVRGSFWILQWMIFSLFRILCWQNTAFKWKSVICWAIGLLVL